MHLKSLHAAAITAIYIVSGLLHVTAQYSDPEPEPEPEPLAAPWWTWPRSSFSPASSSSWWSPRGRSFARPSWFWNAPRPSFVSPPRQEDYYREPVSYEQMEEMMEESQFEEALPPQWPSLPLSPLPSVLIPATVPYGWKIPSDWPADLQPLLLLNSRTSQLSKDSGRCSNANPILNKSPEMLRLFFHDCGTYRTYDNQGGCDGSVRIKDEKQRSDNGDLPTVITLLQTYKDVAAKISLADIIVLAGVVAVRECGGPVIPFYAGRTDVDTVDPPHRLPNPNQPFGSLLRMFVDMGLNLVDMVTLATGGHTLGGAQVPVSGNSPFFKKKNNPFDNTDEKFDNDIFKVVLKREAILNSDRRNLFHEGAFEIVNFYSSNQAAFFRQFRRSYVKMSLLGSNPAQLKGPFFPIDYNKKDFDDFDANGNFPYNEIIPELRGIQNLYGTLNLAKSPDPASTFSYGPEYVAPNDIVGTTFNECTPSPNVQCSSKPRVVFECPIGAVLEHYIPRDGLVCVPDQITGIKFVPGNSPRITAAMVALEVKNANTPANS